MLTAVLIFELSWSLSIHLESGTDLRFLPSTRQFFHATVTYCLLMKGCWVSGTGVAYPRHPHHWVRGGVHTEQVTSSSHRQRERQTTIYPNASSKQFSVSNFEFPKVKGN